MGGLQRLSPGLRAARHDPKHVCAHQRKDIGAKARLWLTSQARRKPALSGDLAHPRISPILACVQRV